MEVRVTAMWAGMLRCGSRRISTCPAVLRVVKYQHGVIDQYDLLLQMVSGSCSLTGSSDFSFLYASAINAPESSAYMQLFVFWALTKLKVVRCLKETAEHPAIFM